MELFGKLLGLGDREYRGWGDSGKRKEVVAHETFELTHESVSTADVNVEPRIHLADDNRFTRIAGPVLGSVR